MAETDEKGSFEADAAASAVREARPFTPDGGATAAAGDAAADGASEVERLAAELERSRANGRELLAKVEQEHDRLLRTAAELENVRKRAQREREDVRKFGVEALVKDLVPVVDDLDRALAAAAPGDPLAEGVKLVRAGLEAALARHGVKAFSAMGAPFDPSRHEALVQVPTADAPPGTVVLEHARGFTLHDRLVRPAMVGVAVAPAQTAAGDAAQEPAAAGAATGGGD